MAVDVINLPDLSEEYQVTQEQIDAYRRDGHVLLRGVLKPHEIEAYRPVLTQTLHQHNDEFRPIAERNTHDQAFLQVWNLWERNDQVRPYTMSRRFAKIAADLTGEDTIRLYHDQALYKESGGGYTPWHQDQYYWPVVTPNSLTMWMPLVDCPVEMGALTFASGSQDGGLLAQMDISDEGQIYFERVIKEKGYPIINDSMKAGDCTFHSGWVLHCAPANNTPDMREVMTVIYYPDGTKLGATDNAGRLWDLEHWFPGQRPGQVAKTHLNPILYSR